MTTSTHSLGGVQRYSASVEKALEELGWQVVMFEAIYWETFRARLVGVWRTLRAAKGARVVWALHPRLGTACLVIARLRRVPMIISTHGYETWGRYRPFSRFAVRQADVVTVVSKFTKAMIGRPGIDAVLVPPTFSFSNSEEDAVLKPQSERRTVTFVGRLDAEYKGLSLFLDLAHRLAPEYPDWEFVAAGGLDPLGSVPTPATEAVRVLANTSDDELAELYCASAVVVLPSKATRDASGRWTGGEGFGIVMLDAALHGAVVVTSDEGACPEAGGLLGNALITHPDLEDVLHAVRTLMENETAREQLALRGREEALRRFSHPQFRECVAETLRTAQR